MSIPIVAVSTVDLSYKPVLTYHLVPDWQNREGWKGAPLVCNIYVHAGTKTVFGNNYGVVLPEEVVSPCGFRVYFRQSVEDSHPPGSAVATVNGGRMGDAGTTKMRRTHADKIGRPCRRCFPGPAR